MIDDGVRPSVLETRERNNTIRNTTRVAARTGHNNYIYYNNIIIIFKVSNKKYYNTQHYRTNNYL